MSALSKAERDKLVKLYGKKIAIQEWGGVPIKLQQRAHDKFFEALEKTLAKHGRPMLLDEEWAGLEKAARNWWSKKAFRGPAIDW